MGFGDLGEASDGNDARLAAPPLEDRAQLLRRIQVLECCSAVDAVLSPHADVAAAAAAIAPLLQAAFAYPSRAVVSVQLSIAAAFEDTPAPGVACEAVVRDDHEAVGRITGWYIDPLAPLLPVDQELLEGIAAKAGAWVTRCAADRALRESEAHHRALLDNLPQRIFIKDRASRYVTMNNKLAADYGATPATWPGTTDFAYHPAELAEKYRADDQRIMTTGMTDSFDEEYVRDGERRLIHTYKAPVRDAQGEVIGVLGVFDDVTELRQAVDQLRENKARYRTLLDSIPQLVFIKDCALRFVVINQRMAEAYHTTPEEAVGKRDEDYIGATLAAKYQAEDVRVLAAGAAENYDDTYLKDGERRHVNCYKTPVRAASGDIIGLLGVFSDITERKRSEEALRASSAEMRAILEHVPAVTYRAPAEALLSTRYVSPQIESLLGYDAGHFFSNPQWWQDALHPEDRERVLVEFRSAAAAGAPVQSEFRFVRSDGGVVWCRNHAVLMRDDPNQPPYYLGFLIDITAERKAQAENAGLAAAVRQAGESIEVTDRKGIVLYVNPAHHATSGYTAEELVGKHISILKSGQHDEAFYKALWTTLTNGETWKGTLINRRKDGTLYEEEATISPVLDGTGQATSYVAVKRDVTEQRELARQMHHAEKMQAIGTLAGGIAHDMNNVLAAIMGHAELALDEVPPHSGPAEDLSSVVAAARRARDLVQQILTFSRRSEDSKQPLLLQEVLAEALRLLRPSLPSTIAVREAVHAACPTVMADGSQMHQIVVNLCTNAYHAMRDRGGTLTVGLEPIEVDAEFAASKSGLQTGPHVCLTVRDTGCGMSRSLQERIFEPFFTTKPQGEGTGLGLSTVHGIVTSHGGVVSVESEVGHGTQFSVYLPSAGQRVAEAPTATAPLSGGTERLLVVDDERDLGALMERSLTRFGYTVDLFDDSGAALEAVQRDPMRYDLIITDQTMPGLTGTELSRQIMQVRPDLPIILTTGFSEAVTPEAAREMGIHAFLMKPARPKQLAALVREVLDQTASRDVGRDPNR